MDQVPVEVIDFDKEGNPKVYGRGWVSIAELKRRWPDVNVGLSGDGILRLSNLCWETMTDEARRLFMLTVGCEPT